MVLRVERFAVDSVMAGVETPRILRYTTVSFLEGQSSNFCLNTILVPSLIRSVRSDSLIVEVILLHKICARNLGSLKG